jgi:hypothetical protein
VATPLLILNVAADIGIEFFTEPVNSRVQKGVCNETVLEHFADGLGGNCRHSRHSKRTT